MVADVCSRLAIWLASESVLPGKQDDEFAVVEPGQQIHLAERRLGEQRDRIERHVGDRLAVLLPNLRVVVDLQVHHGERNAEAMTLVDAAVQDVDEGRPAWRRSRSASRRSAASACGTVIGSVLDDRQALGAVVPVAAVAAGFLRFVEGFVGPANQPSRFVVADADAGHADAGGHGQRSCLRT